MSYKTSIINLLLSVVTLTIFISCNRKIDNLKLIETLQQQVDNVMEQGYLIDQINIGSKSFESDGPDEVGYLQGMLIYAVSADPTIEYLARFSYSPLSKELTFHGYPAEVHNKKKDKKYNSKPDLSAAMSKLDEIKKLIPENYKYKNILSIKYMVEDNQAIYEFYIELEPDSEKISNPNVRQRKVEYMTHSVNKNRGPKKGQITYKKEKKIQHTMDFRLIDNQVEIK